MTTIANAVIGAAERAVAAVAVARTVAVVSYNADQQTVRVRELVGEKPIEIDGVPIQWPIDAPPEEEPRGVTWGIRPGSRGLLLVRDVSHDEVDAGSALPVVPASSRRWNLSDGVFCPGFVVPGSLPSSAYRGDGQMVIAMPVGEVLRIGVSTADRALALAQETAARIERVEAYLNRATYSTPAGTTVAPSPAPFSGTTSLFPTCVASVVLGSVAATTEAALRSTRIKVDT